MTKYLDEVGLAYLWIQIKKMISKSNSTEGLDKLSSRVLSLENIINGTGSSTGIASKVDKASGKADKVSGKVDKVSSKVNELSDKINELSGNISTNTHSVESINTSITEIKGKIRNLKQNSGHGGMNASVSNHTLKITNS